jgi:hypothetical protein
MAELGPKVPGSTLTYSVQDEEKLEARLGEYEL